MRSRYTVREQECAHFVTSTIVDWLPLFTLPSCCDILVQSLEFCRQNKSFSEHSSTNNTQQKQSFQKAERSQRRSA